VLFLGISAYSHDAAVALLHDAKILGFVEEERLNREKHTTAFPRMALQLLLSRNGLELSDVDEVAFFVKPWQLIVSRTLRTLRYFPRSAAVFTRNRTGAAREFMTLDHALRNGAFAGARPARFRSRFVEHHVAHAASSYHLSNFDDAAIMSIDGAGEDITTWFGRGQGNRIDRRHAIRLPHSIGLFYSAVTDHLGFKPFGGEGKVMGLAPYGDPERYIRQMREVLRWTDDGKLSVDLRYFLYHLTGQAQWTSPAFDQLFGPRRVSESPLEQHHEDLAAALQQVTEEAALALVRHLHALVPSKNLCLAGGVALNSVMNGRIEREGPFERVFIQPAANDGGTALGGALFVAHSVHGLPRDRVDNAVYLGPEYSVAECEAAAAGSGLEVERPADVVERAAEVLSEGRIIGWFQGRMECGPRALGNRSILADPRDPGMKDRLNHRVKHREGFRPFAPSVLAESASDWFDDIESSPYMLLVNAVRADKRTTIPAVTHVDGTARVQTVTPQANATYHRLLSAFGRRTGVPVLVNTSFNVRGEPIVCTPEDAVRCFKGTEMDYLALGPLLLRKGS
jgi:carbamoyltransferase